MFNDGIMVLKTPTQIETMENGKFFIIKSITICGSLDV
jgi:hypothetical protein